MDEVLPHVPLDHIVLETDSPYLTPTPHRGKRNEPAYIPLIGQRVAEIKNITLTDVRQTTTQNARKLFNA
jgi:TatD DNase family protein